MNNTVFIVTGTLRGVSYHEEFHSVIDAMDYYQELSKLHVDIELELNKVITLAKQGGF